MKLKQYLQKESITYSNFANLMKVHERTVFAWIKGIRFPGRKNMRKIEKVTQGNVTYRDFEF